MISIINEVLVGEPSETVLLGNVLVWAGELVTLTLVLDYDHVFRKSFVTKAKGEVCTIFLFRTH